MSSSLSAECHDLNGENSWLKHIGKSRLYPQKVREVAIEWNFAHGTSSGIASFEEIVIGVGEGYNMERNLAGGLTAFGMVNPPY